MENFKCHIRTTKMNSQSYKTNFLAAGGGDKCGLKRALSLENIQE